VETWRIAEAESIAFPNEITDLIEKVCNRLDIPNMRIFSGAGHDARQLHFVCPTGMIFVPCEKGISHNEAENTNPRDLAEGTRVLSEVLIDLAERLD
jgi:N-carbamoyl-L-amino-acid hydrolase